MNLSKKVNPFIGLDLFIAGYFWLKMKHKKVGEGLEV